MNATCSASLLRVSPRKYLLSSSRWAGVAGLMAGLFATELSAATLTVGPGQTYKTIASAVAAAHNGDTVNVTAGLYVNDYPVINTNITLQAVGGMARIQSIGFIPNEKGIILVNASATISGFMLYGAKVTENQGGNGAGIRYQGGNLTLINCYIYNNEDGMLANPVSNATITIKNSEFYHNGAATGASSGYTHNLYVNDVAKLDIENSYFHGANVGHEIKSRAAMTIVNNTRIVDGPTGTASYSIDLPQGGVAVITNNYIEQGPDTQNPIIIAYGEEGGVYNGSSLTLQNNLIENDLHSGNALGLWNTTGITATMSGTSAFGLNQGQLTSGPVTVTGTKWLTAEPAIPAKHPW